MKFLALIILFFLLAVPAESQNLGGGVNACTDVGDNTGISEPCNVSIPGCPISSQPTNLLSEPNTFTNGDWSKAGASVTAAQADDPCTGSNDATLLVDTTQDAAHNMYQDATTTGDSTSAIFVKQATGRYVVLSESYGGNTGYAWAAIDTYTGTITQTGSGGTGVTYVSSSIQSDGGGWYYVTLTASAPGTTYYALAISNTGTPGNNAPAYTGIGTGVYIFQARMSEGTQ